jgi:hypothetical protein
LQEATTRFWYKLESDALYASFALIKKYFVNATAPSMVRARASIGISDSGAGAGPDVGEEEAAVLLEIPAEVVDAALVAGAVDGAAPGSGEGVEHPGSASEAAAATPIHAA